jgi:hypothetical protein
MNANGKLSQQDEETRKQNELSMVGYVGGRA